MSQYPTNPISSGPVPITQQPLSGSTPNNYSEMPKPVMGGDVPVVPISEAYNPPPYSQLQQQQPPMGFQQPPVGFQQPPMPGYNPYPNSGQPLQTFYGPGHPQQQMNPYPPMQQQGFNGPNYSQMPGQPPVEEGGFAKMAGSLLNQLNPSAFAHSGIPGLPGAPTTPSVMPLPPREGIPPGLELLADMDEILVKQKAEFLEIMTGYETANRYNVCNTKGERIYFAGESTEIGALCCGGPHRPFQITIIDFSGRTVLVIERPCDWPLYVSNCWICCCCWLGTIGGRASVKLADGTVLGEIVHKFGWYKPKFEILDSTGNTVMSIAGRNCGDCCLCQNWLDQCCSTEFPVTLTDGTHLGTIKKNWGGFRELLTDADSFGVNFPANLDVKWKSLITGAVFLLDFMYYEQKTEPLLTTS